MANPRPRPRAALIPFPAPPLPASLPERLDVVVTCPGRRATRARTLGRAPTEVGIARVRWPEVVPGQLLTIVPAHTRFIDDRPYFWGDVSNIRLDVAPLGLAPLRLDSRPGDRPTFELQRVVPTEELLAAAVRMRRATAEPYLLLLLEADLRCLEAHAQLGELMLRSLSAAKRDVVAERALRIFEVGVAIGDLSVPSAFAGVLPSRHAGNVAFLRCLRGLGTALWRLDRTREAGRALRRLLALDPDDALGARELLADLRARRAWRAP
jgi:hypothetical protein